MSWVTRIQQDIIIQTGDGKRFTPNWLNASLLQQYNITEFNFPNVEGSFVRKRRPRGRKFAIELYFQGDDHLDISEEFRLSAADERHWHILHPFYDEIRVQPQSLTFDNRKYNVSKITGIVIETIAGIFPRSEFSLEDQIIDRKAALNEAAAQNYADQTDAIQSSEVALVDENVDVIEASTEAIIEVEQEKIDFRNIVLDAKSQVNNLITEPLNALRSVQAVIDFPFQVTNSVSARVNALVDQFNRVLTSVGTLTGASRNNKVYVENNGATFISAACTTSINNRDYESRADVDQIVGTIVAFQNTYLETLDEMQTASQTQEGSYAPDPDVVRQVQELVNFTLSKLAEIALGAQQEFTIINEADSNAIILAHRVYGLDENDANIDRFIETNNIGLNEILNIPKDREIVYFV